MNSDLSIDGELVRKRYLRTDRGQPEREWSALTLLNDSAPGLAARPITRIGEPPTLVMSRVAGAPFDEPLTPRQTRAMVAAYRSLFAVPVPPEMQLRYKHPASFVLDVVEWLTEETLCDHPGVVDEALDSAARWHADAPAGVAEIHDAVLAQGDGNVTNMLWDGTRVSLVDFEYAGVGDLSFEVADLVEHASSRLRGLLDVDLVIAGFELTPGQLARVEACRIILASFWLLMCLPGGPGHELNPPDSSERQARHLLSLVARWTRDDTGGGGVKRS